MVALDFERKIQQNAAQQEPFLFAPEYIAVDFVHSDAVVGELFVFDSDLASEADQDVVVEFAVGAVTEDDVVR